MRREEQVALMRHKSAALAPLLNERTPRCWAATEAQALGYGGSSLGAEAVGLARGTIHAGVAAVQAKGTDLETQRSRSFGGGRQKLTEKEPALGEALNQLVEPTPRGDPAAPRRWPSKRTTRLAQEVGQAGHPISQRSVCSLLHLPHSSAQAKRKTRAGRAPPDRDAQLQYSNASVTQFHRAPPPLIAVETKTKELIGNFKNPGRDWQPTGSPEEVKVHDFADPALGKGIPYGV